MTEPIKKRASFLTKAPCILCGQPTAPFWKNEAKEPLCMKCWRIEKARTDPYFALNDRLLEQVYHSEAGIDSLTADEKVVYTVRELIMQVLNGGFHQYFYNPCGAHCAAAETALATLGETEALALLVQARQAFFAGEVPAGTKERREAIPFAHESPGATFTDLAGDQDSRFTQLSDVLESRVQLFAKETGLALSGSHPNRW